MGDAASVAATFYSVFLQLTAKVSNHTEAQWSAGMHQMNTLLAKSCDKLLTILSNGSDVLNGQKRPRPSMERLLSALGVRLVERQEKVLQVAARLHTLLPVVMEIGRERKFSFPMLKTVQ